MNPWKLILVSLGLSRFVTNDNTKTFPIAIVVLASLPEFLDFICFGKTMFVVNNELRLFGLIYSGSASLLFPFSPLSPMRG